MYVFSDSVLCLAGKCPTRPTPGQVCENQRLFSFVSTPEFCQLHDIAGEPIVCKWRIYSGQSTIQIFVKIEKMLQSESVNSFHLKSRINFMPMYNDIDWDLGRRKEEVCEQNSSRVAAYASFVFRKDDGLSSDLEMKKKWFWSLTNKPDGK